MAKPEEQPSARRSISTYCAERADCANGCCAIWSWFVGTWRAAPICPQSRRLKGEEALCLIAEDLAALEQAANVFERRVMEQEKVPMAEKIISLSDRTPLLSLKEDGTPWWVTARNWHAAGAALSPGWCCLGATRPTARTLFRWSRNRSPTPESFLRWSAPMMATAVRRG